MDGSNTQEGPRILSNDLRKRAVELHRKHKGKLSVEIKPLVDEKDSLTLLYSPGVGEVSRVIAEDKSKAKELTGLSNTVAVVSDGSAVLGLGDIGPVAALPVMEGKSLLFKHFAGIDSFPIVLDVHTADEIVAACKAIAPSFGAINLEDIKAPFCFEVEDRLKEELDIPVFHDDQHGTAVVVLAGLINLEKLSGIKLSDRKYVIAGAGAAGIAIAKLLNKYTDGASIFMVDSKGVISPNRKDLSEEKKEILKFSNLSVQDGQLGDIIEGADTFIGVSKAGLLTEEMVASMDMNRFPTIFALANPDPEILPDNAKKAGAKVVATGRSDYPNQVNNALVFPGIFRGALDNGVSAITDDHKIKAAEALAAMVDEPNEEKIVPSIFDEGLVEAIARVIV